MEKDRPWSAHYKDEDPRSFFSDCLSPTDLLAGDKHQTAWFLSECTRLSYVRNEQSRALALAAIGISELVWFEPKDLAAALWLYRDHCIVVFRGTEVAKNWIRNIDAQPQTATHGMVHSGFQKGFEHCWQGLQEHMPQQFSQLVCTGHSLGAAMASIAGQHLDADLVCTFGSPRVGDQKYVEEYSTQHWRYCTVDDVVTHLPPSNKPFNYQHIGEAIWLGEKARKRDRFKQRLKQPELFFKTPKHISDHDPINYSKRLAELIQQ